MKISRRGFFPTDGRRRRRRRRPTHCSSPSPSQKASPTGDAPKPRIQAGGLGALEGAEGPVRGAIAPDLTPVYKMWEQLTGMSVDLTKISHLDVMDKLRPRRRAIPQYDLMVTNTMAEPEIARSAGIFRGRNRAKGSRPSMPSGCARPDYRLALDHGVAADPRW